MSLPDRFCVKDKSDKIFRLYLHSSSISPENIYIMYNNKMLDTHNDSTIRTSIINSKISSDEWKIYESSFKERLPKNYVSKKTCDGREGIISQRQFFSSLH